MKLALIDNYDSFTWNLVEILRHYCLYPWDIFPNDEVVLEDLKDYRKILLSPGPGKPAEAGRLLDIVRAYYEKADILGICLGHQAIGEVFGAKLIQVGVFHGLQSRVFPQTNDPLLDGLHSPFWVGRYHSWVIDRDSIPEDIEITSLSEDGYIMSLRHKRYCVAGVQFHPESYMTPQGALLIKNWLMKF